ncbi:Hemerythrin HHE cation binding domain-containing protein [Asanoa hainanensis]|uniref:Hemerythrin HHE cation binding domain-containing protein n=1 Tax=Asanoa hainanensis TaxID=560556 RepID=A0A239KJF0_9ACTN|nr:LLM class flavin-dependent oxidoreductase [Asanoa hainanensis]SNT18281.1 Hemerythrin HHE cation binding domain-containing protein [Asanoa hainanensis]
MADYGHELLFGTFVTPRADAPERVVALAQIADQAGLDLVTAQDHPYQAGFLDTWTLLSMIIGRTERIRVSPNVANLPLRPPAVLARSAASLDLLSGGRVELGLGAGAFWDAIVANGGPHRTPAESVEALEEGIAVIRGIWGQDGPSVRVNGKHYQVRGAKVGPEPAHDIGIWVGAYKPRMLRLIGRLADGWLPTLGYVKADQLPEMNKLIDDAAVKAGRAPEAIRRLANFSGVFGQAAGGGFGGGGGGVSGSPADWAEQLAELALTHGLSAFILAADDATTTQRFAVEVVPAVRELVAAERAHPRTPAPSPEPALSPETAPVQEAPDRIVVSGEIPGLGLTPTPDDGTRLSDRTLWDESERPVAPRIDEERKYSRHERARGQQLIDIHDHLRQELAQVRDLIDQVEAGMLGIGEARSAINEMTLRQNNWTLGTYCESYCRLITTHHTIEDASMLPNLRRADARLAPVTLRLEDEHKVIHEVIENVDRALVALVAGEGDLKSLRSEVDLLTDTLLSHLSYEERSLVEPLARYGAH